MTLWQRLIEHWKKEGICIRPAVTPADIRWFEERHAVVLPADLRSYLLTIDGSTGHDFNGGCLLDSWLMTFRSLAEIEPIGERELGCEPYVGAFVVADHDLSSVLWVVFLDNEPQGNSGPVFRIGMNDPPDRPFAPTFSLFVEAYLGDPASLLRSTL